MNGEDRLETNRQKHPFLAVLGITVAYLYALFFSIVVLTFNQIEVAKQYMGVVFAAVSMFCIILFAINTRLKVTRVEFCAIFYIAYVLFNIYLTSAIHGEFSKVASDTFLEFGVKAVPAIFCALLLARSNAIYDLISCIDYFTIITSIGFGKVLITGMATGISRAGMQSTFGVDYQGISYYAAYMFLLNAYMMFIGHCNLSNSIFRSYKFQVVRGIMAAIQFLVSLYSGGRGGFILILITIITMFAYMVIKEHNYKFLFGGIVILIVVWLTCGRVIENNPLFSAGFERIFAFVGNNGINWEGTSGRKEIYDLAFERIAASPVWGYGITGGSYVGVLSCHNLFLDVLVEGGLLYFTFGIVILVLFLAKLLKKIKQNRIYVLFFVIFLGDFVNLMFSTIYLRSTAIWFAMFYIFNEKEDYRYEEKNWDAELP